MGEGDGGTEDHALLRSSQRRPLLLSGPLQWQVGRCLLQGLKPFWVGRGG